MDVDTLMGLVGPAIKNQVFVFSIAFILAARLHAKEVRKEIAISMKTIADSIDNVRIALENELKAQTSRIDKMDGRVSALEGLNKKESTNVPTS